MALHHVVYLREERENHNLTERITDATADDIKAREAAAADEFTNDRYESIKRKEYCTNAHLKSLDLN